jgi:probable HAF family extracellular repeat protein
MKIKSVFPLSPIARLVLSLTMLVPVLPHATASTSYVITDLGAVDGYALNNNGQAVGASYGTNGLQRPFLYSNGSLTELGSLGGAEGAALGINNSGQVVGWSDTSNGVQHAFLYGAGTLQDLGTLGGSNSYAYAISDAGQIVGWSETTSGVAHAFSYRAGVMTDLGSGYAAGVNTNGQVVGWSPVSSLAWHAFLYTGATKNDLGTLGGPRSEALAINNTGQVVGWSDLTNGTEHGFLYNGGTMQDLGTLGGTNSRATALNNTGAIVGAFDTNDISGLHAFLYTGGVATDLNTTIDSALGWVLSYPQAINDKNWILVSAIGPSDSYHTLLLTPGGSTGTAVLSINLVNDSLVVSWPASVTGYRLFQSQNLSVPNWTVVTNTPIVSNGLNQVIFSPIPSDTGFFRLQSP